MAFAGVCGDDDLVSGTDVGGVRGGVCATGCGGGVFGGSGTTTLGGEEIKPGPGGEETKPGPGGEETKPGPCWDWGCGDVGVVGPRGGNGAR